MNRAPRSHRSGFLTRSNHVAEHFAYAAPALQFVYRRLAAGRYRSRFRICRPTLPNTLLTPRPHCGLCIAGWQPVAIAPGSVFVEPRCRTLCLRRARIAVCVSQVGSRSLSLPVPYLSSHVAEHFAYAAARALHVCISQVGSGRYRSRFRIRRPMLPECLLHAEVKVSHTASSVD
jgi:hypothetical protein